MFGYIVPAFSALSEEQKASYRGYYCGLCGALAETTGKPGRLTLSNDLTFVYLLLDSLYEPAYDEKRVHCPVHPVKKQTVITSAVSGYCADMNLLLTWYKLADQYEDDGNRFARLTGRKMDGLIGEITRRHPERSLAIGKAVHEINALEKQITASQQRPDDLDRLCNLTGEILAQLCLYKENDPWGDLLRGLGSSLGRFIYLMDAYDDLKKDISRKRFNPLIPYMSRPDLDAFTHDTLNIFASEAAGCLETLPLEKNLDILRNIVYSGIWQRWAAVHSAAGKEKTHDE
ncbi:MAG: DUF5685 family protein [Clostridia bacterium]|nr:DUF5685 family protein [Clostridia bacterium]